MTSRDQQVRRIALTGGIATGKSHVRQVFEKLGVPTIDADVLARDAVSPGTAGLEQVLNRFGADLVDSSGRLDRQRLGSIVFSDDRARRDLEAIVHPLVQKATDAWFESVDANQHPFAIDDIPLLFEANRDKDFDAVIVVAAQPDVQLRRLMDRDQLSEEDARRRIAAQLPIDDKIRRADYVIRTDGSFEDTDRQIRRVFESLRARYSSSAS
jgi:dephospho-CoA kinase